jgi:regulator of protease activity HflC (stomatin/prohibitin superfamily)
MSTFRNIIAKQTLLLGGIPVAVLTGVASYALDLGIGASAFAMSAGFLSGTAFLVAAGLQKLPVGYKGLRLWLGARQPSEALSEGYVWWYPSPLGGILQRDCRVKNLDVPLKKVVTEDKVEVEMGVSISYHVGPGKAVDGSNPSAADWAAALDRFFNTDTADFEKQLIEEAAEKFRAAAGKLSSGEIHKAQDDIVLGVSVDGERSGGVKGALQVRAHEFGANIKEVQITNITLPESMTKAAADIRAEEAQKRAEATEREGIEAAIDAYVAKGLTPAEAARLHGLERKKGITEEVKTINIPGLTEVASVIGAAIGSAISSKKGGDA